MAHFRVQAYEEFKPLDGQFRANVLLQTKNGPVDFQPREPFSPLFGAMPKTPMMMELEIGVAQMYCTALQSGIWRAPHSRRTCRTASAIKAQPCM